MFAARNAFMTPKVAAPSNISMLLKFEGNFTDSTGNHNVTVYGNTNAASGGRFGNGATFDGDGDYIMPSAGDDLQFGTGDFCIELFFMLYSMGGGKSPFLFDWRPLNTVTAAPALNVGYNNSTGINYYAGSNNVITGTSAISIYSWYHAAIARASGVTKLFLNGVQQGSSYTDSNNYTTNQPTIGALGYLPSLTTYATHGVIDEFRVTKGAARYTSNFSVPTAGFTYP